MHYREFGTLGIEISALGFGAMRLPVTEKGTIDETEAIRLIRYAIDHGVNYVDTAYPYHQGESECLVGKALKDGYRDVVYLATKCPVWLIEKEEDFDRILDEQLEKLQTDHIDFYLLHALSRERMTERVEKFHLVEKAKAAKEAGKIRYLGFSFHDELEVFKEIVDYTEEWDFCQIQYNYINLDYQAGREGLLYAAERGLGVIVMEPLLGGKLADLAPHVADELPKDKSQVEFALDFLWDQPEVGFLLSGMSSFEQVESNLEYADRSRIGMVSAEERECYACAKAVFDRMALVNCTGCRYCMPCPFGLEIPDLFTAYNMSASHGMGEAKEAYGKLLVKAEACQACRHCEEECPQHIKISEVMPKVAKTFAES